MTAAKVINLKDRVLILPNRGKLVVGTDLHGHKPDYLRLMKKFCNRLETGEDIYLLLLGDLVHGPKKPEQTHDRYKFVSDDSEFIVDHLRGMQDVFPGRIFSLLGNHEHAHIGGPVLSKFCPDEALALEEKIGAEKTAKYKSFFSSLPLIALSHCGIAFTHGAPTPSIKSIEQVVNAEYNGEGMHSIPAMYKVPVLDLLWRRGATNEEARMFLEAINSPGKKHNLVVYGHDIVREGFAKEGPHQLVLSTSFGLKDKNKTYIEIDLSSRYESTSDLVVGRELLPLWDASDIRDETDYEFALKAVENGRIGTANYAIRKGEESVVSDYLKARIYLKQSNGTDIVLVDDAITLLERSSQGKHLYNNQIPFFLGVAYEMRGDLLDKKVDKVLSFTKAMGHYSDADTYEPSKSDVIAKARFKLENKLLKMLS